LPKVGWGPPFLLQKRRNQEVFLGAPGPETGVASRHEALLAELRRLVEPVVAEVGLELVELKLGGSSRRRTVRLDIDRAGPSGVDMDDCQRISGEVGRALDATDLLPGSYVLEVSSPGADRPIREAEEIRRNTGRRIVVATTEPIEECRDFHGVLLGSESGQLLLRLDDDRVVRIPLDHVQSARQEVSF
jgi:ribosome maturation factor RimP